MVFLAILSSTNLSFKENENKYGLITNLNKEFFRYSAITSTNITWRESHLQHIPLQPR